MPFYDDDIETVYLDEDFQGLSEAEAEKDAEERIARALQTYRAIADKEKHDT